MSSARLFYIHELVLGWKNGCEGKSLLSFSLLLLLLLFSGYERGSLILVFQVSIRPLTVIPPSNMLRILDYGEK